MNKKFILIFVILASVIAALVFAYRHVVSPAGVKTESKKSASLAYDISTPSSITVIVNKQRQFQEPKYVPSGLAAPAVPLRLDASAQEMQLAPAAKTALEQLVAAASQEGAKLRLESGYRSYEAQEMLYNYYVARQGQAKADRESARAGFSEHQTGLAADVGAASGQCSIDACFAELPEGKWVAANGYKYGFVIRYPAGKEVVTGYTYEPWHLRYIGADAAQKFHDSGRKTLEEFFELPAAPDYN